MKSNTKHGCTEDIGISHPPWCVTIVPLQIAIWQQLLLDNGAKRMAYANWALSEFEEIPQ